MLWTKRRRKFLAVFVLRERETFHIIGKRRIRSTTKIVKYRGGAYPVDVSYPTYTKKNKNIYFLDVKIINQYIIDGENQKREGKTDFERDPINPVSLDGTDSRYELMSPKTLSTLIHDKNLRAMFSSITKTASFRLTEIIIGLIAGVGIGWLIRDIMTGGYF